MRIALESVKWLVVKRFSINSRFPTYGVKATTEGIVAPHFVDFA